MEFVVQYASRTQLVATSSHLVVRIIDGHRTVADDFDRLDEVVKASFADVPSFGVLQILYHGNQPPPPDVRRRAAALMESYADRACVVVALLGLGFWSSTLRAAINGLSSLLRLSEIHVEGSVEAAAEQLARELIGLDAPAIVDASEQLLDHMRTL